MNEPLLKQPTTLEIWLTAGSWLCKQSWASPYKPSGSLGQLVLAIMSTSKLLTFIIFLASSVCACARLRHPACDSLTNTQLSHVMTFYTIFRESGLLNFTFIFFHFFFFKFIFFGNSLFRQQ